MKVLLTGGTSLLGSTVAQALRERGDTVRLFQRGPGPAGFEEQRGDIADADAVKAAVSGVEAVIHLAARVGIVGTRAAFRETNVEGTAT